MITPTHEFWKIFKETNGALSCTEAVAIMNIVAQAPDGTWLELGTHKGKSTMAAIYGGKPLMFELIDPEFEKEISTPEITDSISRVIKEQVKLAYIVGYSTEYLQQTNGMYSYVFVDSGSHQDGLPMQEVRLLEDRLVQGGIICFHDYQSQFIEVAQAYDYLVSIGKYEPIYIDWQPIIEYVNENNLEEGNQSWHHNELKNPCFVGAVKRK